MTEMILLDLERRVNNNYFKSKSELVEYINEIRQNKQLDREVFDRKVEELLNLYDKYNKSELPLNMEDYKDVKMQDSNYIVSGETDKVLRTNTNHGDLSQEFKQIQNEIIANSQNGSVNADTVFNHMEKYQKESSTLMPLSNLNIQIIDKDMLDKIRFFIKNGNVNIFEYQVDISNGIFLNINTNELFEVRKDSSTNQFRIYKGSEAQYKSEIKTDSNSNNTMVTDDIATLSDEELMEYQARRNLSSEERQLIENEMQKRKNKPKTRVLRLNPLDGNRAAFAKTSFLIIMLFLSSIMCALLLLLLK